MLLQGKCAAIPKQIESKIEYGITDFELQLFKEDAVDVVIDILKDFPDVRINTVHTALDNWDAVNLDSLGNPMSWLLLQRACYIAQYLAERQNNKVGVVLHNTYTAEQFRKHPETLDIVVERVKYISRKFEQVYLMIENITPYNAESLMLYNNCTPEQMFDVLSLFDDKGVKLYVTLDLCHSTMTKDTYEKMLLGTSLQKQWVELESTLTYKGWFSLLSDYIVNLHIAKAIGDGHGHGKHGAPLNSFDKASISQLYEMCKMYSPNAIWTVEVFEDDYTNPVNLFATYEFCKHVFGGTNQ